MCEGVEGRGGSSGMGACVRVWRGEEDTGVWVHVRQHKLCMSVCANNCYVPVLCYQLCNGYQLGRI